MANLVCRGLPEILNVNLAFRHIFWRELQRTFRNAEVSSQLARTRIADLLECAPEYDRLDNHCGELHGPDNDQPRSVFNEASLYLRVLRALIRLGSADLNVLLLNLCECRFYYLCIRIFLFPLGSRGVLNTDGWILLNEPDCFWNGRAKIEKADSEKTTAHCSFPIHLFESYLNFDSWYRLGREGANYAGRY
jgi:hypothetical protein